MNDYYEILGIDKGSSKDDIKKAYRKVAMKYHPDRNPGDKEAETKFKEAAEAYSVLSDNQKKAQYDQFGHAGVNGNGFNASGFSDLNDIFSNSSVENLSYLYEEFNNESNTNTGKTTSYPPPDTSNSIEEFSL